MEEVVVFCGIFCGGWIKWSGGNIWRVLALSCLFGGKKCIKFLDNAIYPNCFPALNSGKYAFQF